MPKVSAGTEEPLIQPLLDPALPHTFVVNMKQHPGCRAVWTIHTAQADGVLVFGVCMKKEKKRRASAVQSGGVELVFGKPRVL